MAIPPIPPQILWGLLVLGAGGFGNWIGHKNGHDKGYKRGHADGYYNGGIVIGGSIILISVTVIVAWIYYSKKWKSEPALTTSEEKNITNANDRQNQEQRGGGDVKDSEGIIPSRWDFSDLCLRREEFHIYSHFVNVICKDMVTEFIKTKERAQTDSPTIMDGIKDVTRTTFNIFRQPRSASASSAAIQVGSDMYHTLTSGAKKKRYRKSVGFQEFLSTKENLEDLSKIVAQSFFIRFKNGIDALENNETGVGALAHFFSAHLIKEINSKIHHGANDAVESLLHAPFPKEGSSEYKGGIRKIQLQRESKISELPDYWKLESFVLKSSMVMPDGGIVVRPDRELKQLFKYPLQRVSADALSRESHKRKAYCKSYLMPFIDEIMLENDSKLDITLPPQCFLNYKNEQKLADLQANYEEALKKTRNKKNDKKLSSELRELTQYLLQIFTGQEGQLEECVDENIRQEISRGKPSMIQLVTRIQTICFRIRENIAPLSSRLVKDCGLEQDLTLLEEHIRNYRKALGGVLFPMRPAHAALSEPSGGQRGLST
jgi:hypothetical protein